MRKKTKDFWQSGHFTLGKDRKLAGEISIDGTASKLRLYSSHFLNPRRPEGVVVEGLLRDLTKLSLLDCVSLMSGEHGKPKERRYYAELFPNFVVSGDAYLRPNEKVITYAEFLIDDAPSLFYDFDAFGIVLDAKGHIARLARSNSKRVGRKIPIGPNPIIQYFAGKHLIFRTETVLGEVSAFHRMQIGMGDPRGASMKNSIWIGVEFDTARSFHEVQNDIIKILRFVEIVIGRRQNLLEINMRRGALGVGKQYGVVWSHPWRRKKSNQEKVHAGDVLLNPIDNATEFGEVLRGWLQHDDERSDSRNRFSTSFAKGSKFSIDRIIGSANAFDILPLSAVPADVELPPAILAAKVESRKLFRNLPPSPERDSVLNALGRVGKSTLKRKVRHRAQWLTNTVGNLLPELIFAADEAVNCRNYYVHGGDARFDYQQHFDVFAFLTETLEFIFGASELVEFGWDIRAWKKSRSGITNPIGRYIINYSHHLARLKEVMPTEPIAASSK